VTTSRRVAVLGGGVAGLATAFDLAFPTGSGATADAAPPPCDVTVFEAAPAAGGHLRTERDHGFTVEWGPNGFLDSEPATLELVGRADLEGELLRSGDAARHRFLWVDGKLQEIPVTPGAFLRSGLLSPSAKLRLATEIFRPRRRDLGRAAENPATDETIFAFGERRLGRAFAATFLDPMVKGITGGDAARLSLAATFPRMVELEDRHGSLFRALFAIGRERKRARRQASRGLNPVRGEGAGPGMATPERQAAPTPGPGGVLHGFRTGVDALPRRLAARLGTRVLTGHAVEGLEPTPRGWTVHAGGAAHGPFAAVVDATPAHAAATHQPDPEVGRLLAGITFAPLAVIALGLRRADVGYPLDGFGMLIPSRERRRLLGVLWSSSIFAGRAPADHVLLRCMAGGREILERDDDALVDLARDEIGDLYELRGAPVGRWIFRHPRGIAQYEVGHLARLSSVETRLARTPGLFLTGSSYRGISINHCVREAGRTAARVRSYLTSAGSRPLPG